MLSPNLQEAVAARKTIVWKHLALAMIASIAASHVRAEDAPTEPFLCKTTKPEDRVTVKLENGAAIVDVVSPSGIGGATVELQKGPWPATVVRLHLKGLESFSAVAGKHKLAGYVLSHSGNAQRLTLSEEGQEGEREAGTTIRVFDDRGKPAAGLPPPGGCFEIALPKVLLEGQPKLLRIAWVDFYR
jgi:hypothetical protein